MNRKKINSKSDLLRSRVMTDAQECDREPAITPLKVIQSGWILDGVRRLATARALLAVKPEAETTSQERRARPYATPDEDDL